MNLQDLNYDCLESIMKLLPLEHQIKVSCVSLLMKDIISSIWIRKYLRHGKLSLTDNEMTPKSIAGFAAVMCEHTEEMIVSDAAVLLILTAFEWPKLRHLEAHVEFGDKTAKIQFLDKQFPALESLDLTWNIKILNNSQRNFHAGLRCGELISLCADEAELTDKLLSEIDICKKQLQKERNYFVAHNLIYRIRGLKYRLDQMAAIATQKYKLLEGINLKCLRKLKLNKFSVPNLSLVQLPQLQELHYETPRQETPYFETKSFRKFLPHVAACVNTQVLNKTRHLPLTLHCYYTHNIVRRRLQTADTEMLRITWENLASTKKDRKLKLMPFYFGHINLFNL